MEEDGHKVVPKTPEELATLLKEDDREIEKRSKKQGAKTTNYTRKRKLVVKPEKKLKKQKKGPKIKPKRKK